MPSPLSSQTKSSGQRQPLVRERRRGVQRGLGRGVVRSTRRRTSRRRPRPAATSCSSPSFRARSIANATPTARGRCEAIVEVCGMTASSWWPKTLCRPPAIGSSAAAVTPRRMSGTAVAPQPGRRAPDRTRPTGSAAAPGRSAAARARPRRSTRARPSRSYRSFARCSSARAPRSRRAGCRPARARAPRPRAALRHPQERERNCSSRCSSSGSRLTATD